MNALHSEKSNNHPASRFFTFLGILLILLSPLACVDSATDPGHNRGNGNNNGNGNDNGNNEPGSGEVWMQNHSFTPSTLEIEAGESVTWTNQDNETHSVTSDDGHFDQSVSPEGQFSYTFEEEGTYTYHCVPHPDMTGTIHVGEQSSQNDNGSGGNGTGDNGEY